MNLLAGKLQFVCHGFVLKLIGPRPKAHWTVLSGIRNSLHKPEALQAPNSKPV